MAFLHFVTFQLTLTRPQLRAGLSSESGSQLQLCIVDSGAILPVLAAVTARGSRNMFLGISGITNAASGMTVFGKKFSYTVFGSKALLEEGKDLVKARMADIDPQGKLLEADRIAHAIDSVRCGLRGCHGCDCLLATFMHHPGILCRPAVRQTCQTCGENKCTTSHSSTAVRSADHSNDKEYGNLCVVELYDLTLSMADGDDRCHCTEGSFLCIGPKFANYFEEQGTGIMPLRKQLLHHLAEFERPETMQEILQSCAKQMVRSTCWLAQEEPRYSPRKGTMPAACWVIVHQLRWIVPQLPPLPFLVSLTWMAAAEVDKMYAGDLQT